MNSGYPGNNEYPKNYHPVIVVVQSRGRDKKKKEGIAYWSGARWIWLRDFKIGYGKVIKWMYEK